MPYDLVTSEQYLHNAINYDSSSTESYQDASPKTETGTPFYPGVGPSPPVPSSCRGAKASRQNPNLDCHCLESPLPHPIESAHNFRFSDVSSPQPYQITRFTYPFVQGKEPYHYDYYHRGCGVPPCTSLVAGSAMIMPPSKFGSRPVISKASWKNFFRDCYYRKFRL